MYPFIKNMHVQAVRALPAYDVCMLLRCYLLLDNTDDCDCDCTRN